MEYLHMMKMEDMNLNKICFSSKSIWVLLVVGLLAVHSVIRLFWFTWRLRFSLRSRSSASIKRRKRADRKKKIADNKTITDVSVTEPLLANTNVSCLRKFTYQSLVDATQGFPSKCRIGADHLGEFFIGKMADTDEVFTVKNMWVYEPHSHEEFVAHLSLLSQADHPNLAKLIGYSFLSWERVWVYEYVPGGSLEDYLYDNDKCLDWNLRMKIALGVARAVEYLQNDMNPSILHLYIDPSNVWLSEEYTPKLSTYGGVMMYSREKIVDFPSEMIGTYCYAKPDYELTKKVTLKTDIYGFGVLLLKIITGKKDYVLGDGLPQKLVDWVQPYLKEKRKMVEMVDPKLGGKFENDELCEVWDIAEACLNERPESRPSIVDLVKRMNHLVTPNYDL
ncbi:hypothetical protein RND81_06G141600 [Saponaria officinalis]|uniref:Protein kinase domain-containing protein n=1 Tax=Saponaria officinalis TaxID=3572 RepID=A0AAW1KB65_SAPOF